MWRVEGDKRRLWRTRACRGLGSGHPRIRGRSVLHSSSTREPALNLGDVWGRQITPGYRLPPSRLPDRRSQKPTMSRAPPPPPRERRRVRGASATPQDVRSRSNLRPPGGLRGPDLPPRTRRGGCGRRHPTPVAQRAQKQQKADLRRRLSRRRPPPPPTVSRRLVYPRRPSGRRLRRFV